MPRYQLQRKVKSSETCPECPNAWLDIVSDPTNRCRANTATKKVARAQMARLSSIRPDEVYRIVKVGYDSDSK